MKKVLFTLVIFIMSIGLAGCRERSFSMNDLGMDFTNISVSDGINGNSVVLDEEQSKELYHQLKNMEFAKENSSKEYTGWSYSLKFLNGDNEIENINIISSDTIEYDGYFYKVREFDLDMENFAVLFKETFQAVVIENGPGLLVAPNKNSDEAKSSDQIVVHTNNGIITDENKQEIHIEDLKIGDVVEVTYNGIIMESYPAQISSDTIKLQGISRLVEAYLTIIDDIYQEDPGLNGDISMIALDTSDMTNLSDWERQILLINMKQKYGMEIIEGTFEDLVEEGLIDKDHLYFPDGILITITNPSFNEKKESLTYEIKKWRSGLGAIGYDGIAQYDDGNWSIKKDSMWIS